MSGEISTAGPSTDAPSTKSSSVSGDHQIPPGIVDYEQPVIRCLALISGLHGHPVSTEALRAGMPLGKERPTLATILRTASQAGLSAKVRHRPQIKTISPLILPCILLLKHGNACVLISLSDRAAEVIFPEVSEASTTVPLPKLQEQYTGYVTLVRPEGHLDRRASELKSIDTRAWFWENILRFTPIYKHVLLATILINILGLAGPLYILNVYDRVVPNNAYDTLWALSLGVLVAYLFDFILRNLRAYFTDVAGKNADVLIASRLMQQLTGMRLDHRPESAGTLVNNMREFETLREFFSSTTLMALVDLPFIFIFIALIGYLGSWLAIAPLLAIPVVILVGIGMQRQFQQEVSTIYREGSQKNAILFEAINGLETIKTSMAEGQVQKRWEEVVGLNARSTGRVHALANFSTSFSQSATQLVGLIIVVGGVYLIAKGQMTLGGLIACNILVGRAMAPLGAVAALLTRLQQSRIALSSLEQLMELPNERPLGQEFIRAQDLMPSIELDNVHFQYANSQVPALQGVTLRISPGERVGIIGRTGSGKSTIGRLCLGLYQPQQGSVRMGGIDLRQLHIADVRYRIGYVSQDTQLFYGSIRENITFGAPYVDGQAILRAATLAGVTDFVRGHPAGFDWQVGERGANLSGGQRQAVTVARALLLDPDILILDEPTSAMDNASEAVFRKRLGTVLKDKTLLIFTHRTGMLQLVDRLVVMDGGKIVADGPKVDVLKALRAGKIATAR